MRFLLVNDVFGRRIRVIVEAFELVVLIGNRTGARRVAIGEESEVGGEGSGGVVGVSAAGGVAGGGGGGGGGGAGGGEEERTNH